MRLVVTGASGQLGWELARSLAPLGEVVALTRGELDLARLDTIGPKLRELQPDVIVNAAAYTAVDQAESDEALASRINGEAVGIMADEAARAGALLIHYSTDYVFDGQKTAPYTETDAVAPLNAYGRSKLQGELAIQNSSAAWMIFRTTWVYGARGQNFLRTIWRLAGERETLRIVADQRGAPTGARLIAEISAHAIRAAQIERRNGKFVPGLYHLSADGQTTWHGFATAIVEQLRELAPNDFVKTTSIEAIASKDYPVPARRPNNSLLDNSKLTDRFDLYRPDWRQTLTTTLQDALAR